MTPFVGIGPGRCGTMSLARILSACRYVWAIHEDYRVAFPLLESCHTWTLGERVFGVVGLSWTYHVETLRDQLDLRAICLHRPKEEVVESFARIGTPPQIEDVPSHWEQCEQIMGQIKEPVLHINTADLSDTETIRRLFRFVGIPTCNWVFTRERRWNQEVARA